MIDDAIPRAVIQQAGLPNNATLTPVGGGFSSAAIWRVESGNHTYALKQYPKTFAVTHLQAIHKLMTAALQAGVTALPEVRSFANGSSSLLHADSVWDLVTWQPGVAALNSEATLARLAATGSILGRLHATWANTRQIVPTCPAIQRRLAVLTDWTTLQPQESPIEFQNAIRLAVNNRVLQLQSEIVRWTNRNVTVQACLCDCWHGHFLFTGDEVTGLIDHGAVQFDHPVVDLARLLGSLELSSKQREAVFDSYQGHRPFSLEDQELMALLEKSGIVCGLIHWYEQLSRGVSLSAAATERIQFLLKRAHALN